MDVSDEPGDFTSYIITIDSVTLTRNDGIVVTAAGTPEIVDLTQVHNIAELWSSGSIPDGTYTSATITVDYTPSGVNLGDFRHGRERPAAGRNVVDAVYQHHADHVLHHDQLRSRQFADDHPHLRIDQRGIASIRFRSGGIRFRRRQHQPGQVYVRPYVTIGMQAPDHDSSGCAGL